MIIGITGHTSGIGKAIYEKYDNSIGFSRSNGYDIGKCAFNEKLRCEI